MEQLFDACSLRRIVPMCPRLYRVAVGQTHLRSTNPNLKFPNLICRWRLGRFHEVGQEEACMVKVRWYPSYRPARMIIEEFGIYYTGNPHTGQMGGRYESFILILASSMIVL